MDDDKVVWPTGMSDQDPAARERPLFFNPQGFLVAILEDADHAERAKAALAEARFADHDLRVSGGKESYEGGDVLPLQVAEVVLGRDACRAGLPRYLEPADPGVRPGPVLHGVGEHPRHHLGAPRGDHPARLGRRRGAGAAAG